MGKSVNLNVPQKGKGKLEITDKTSKAVFETYFETQSSTREVILVSGKNLTKEKEKEWAKIAKLVLLGPNYKGPNKSKGGK